MRPVFAILGHTCFPAVEGLVPSSHCVGWGSGENSTLREAVIAVLTACRYLADSLPQQLEQGMVRMSKRSRVINLGPSITEDVKPLIDLPHEKKAGIGGDLCSLKINADGSVEVRPYGPFLFVTNCARAVFPPSCEFAP